MMDINHRQIQLALVLQLHKLQREGLPLLDYDQLAYVLVAFKWRKKKPSSLHEAIDDVMSLDASTVVVFLSKQAVIDGHKKDLSEFEDVIGGIRE